MQPAINVLFIYVTKNYKLQMVDSEAYKTNFHQTSTFHLYVT